MPSFCVDFSRHLQVAPSNSTGRVIAWLANHFPLTIIWGLVLSHSIVEYSTVCILMLYLINVYQKGLLPSAMIINLLDALSSVSVFIVAYIGDHFNVIIFSSGCYIMGLILLWITGWSFQEFSLLYLSIVLIALGKSCRSFPLQSFLGYQLRHRNINNREEQRQRDVHVGTRIWWHSAWICGYVIVLSTSDVAWNSCFRVSALVMGAASVAFFYLGFVFYDFDDNPEARMPLVRIFKVFKPAEPNKLLLWATFIPYSLVLAAGHTLFLAQFNKLGNPFGKSFRVHSFLFVLKSFTADVVVFLFWCWSKSTRATHTGTSTTLVRMGAGMVCAVLCCVAARQVEILAQDSRSKTSSRSVALLTPQYFLLGLMEGLAGRGLFTYILGHLPLEGSMKSSRSNFAEGFSELVSCVGKIISIPFLLIFKFWFEQNTNIVGHLDGYFVMLAVVGSVSFCLYLYWALNYGGDDLETNLEDGEPETTGTVVETGQTVQQEEHYDEEAEDDQIEVIKNVVEVFINDSNEEKLGREPN